MTDKNQFCYFFFISFKKKHSTVSHCLNDYILVTGKIPTKC